MPSSPVWHGTQDEALDLVNCVSRNCICQFGDMGVRLGTCEPHRMISSDQRVLDGLLFVRYLAERLQAEEFACADPATAVQVEKSLP